jgi:hypothetical protein
MKSCGIACIVGSIGKVKMVRLVSQCGDQLIHQKFSLARLTFLLSRQLAKPAD